MHTAKIHRHKKGASDLEAYQIVIVGNRRLIYHRNAPYPSLKRRPSPYNAFNYYHSHFYASGTMAIAAKRLHLLVP